MQESTLKNLEQLFLGLSDRTRLKLIGLMGNGEVSVGWLAAELGESQPKVSRHLAYLRSAGLVTTRRDGKWIYYSAAPGADAACAAVLRTTLDELKGTSASNPYSEIVHWDEPREPSRNERIESEPEMEIFLL